MHATLIWIPLLLLAGGEIITALFVPRNHAIQSGRNNAIEERDVCATYSVVEKIDDGYPIQTHKHVQLTAPMQCEDDNGCEVSSESSQTFEVGAEVGAGFEWADVGFSVAQSVTTGQSNTCTAKQGETVCVCEAVGFTEYSVDKCEYNYCLPDKQDCEASYRIKSPNKNNQGSKYYCSDTCYDAGYQYWEATGGGSACKEKRDGIEARRLIC